MRYHEILEAENPFAEIEAAWAGGVSDFGDPRAAEAIKKVPGYTGYLRRLRAPLDFPLYLYRAMPLAAYEDWISDGHSFYGGASLDPQVAQNWAKFAAHKAQDLVVIQIVVNEPDAVVMKGKAEESELVLDFGWIQPHDTKIISK